MEFNFIIFGQFVFALVTMMFLFYFWMNWLRSRNFRFNDIFSPRKAYYPQLHKGDMRALENILLNLPIEQRLHALQTLLGGRTAKAALTIAPDGRIYIDQVSIEQLLIEDTPDEQNSISG